MRKADADIDEKTLESIGFYQTEAEDIIDGPIWCFDDDAGNVMLTLWRYDSGTWVGAIGENAENDWPFDLHVMGQVYRLMHACYLEIGGEPIYVTR